MATRIEAAQLLVYKAAMAKASQKTYSVEAARRNFFAAETTMAVTTEVVQLFGGYGYIREYDVERMMRDAKITEIYRGSFRGSAYGYLGRTAEIVALLADGES